MTDRNQILSNIRKGRALSNDQMRRPLFRERNRGELWARWRDIEAQNAGRMDELVKAFKRECEDVAGKAYVARNHDEACGFVSTIIKDSGAKKVIRWDSALLEKLGIDHLIHSIGTGSIPQSQNNLTAKADLGISEAAFGLADTGTLVLRASPGRDRSTSLLPPSHIAVLESKKILFTLDDLLVRLLLDFVEKGDLGTCITLITGPSRTADIELNLVHGIHGPKSLHVIILNAYS